MSAQSNTTPPTQPTPTAAMAPYAPPSAAMSETSSTAAAAMATAAVQARYVMALQRPRDWDDVRVRLLKECKRPSFAAVADYARPVGRTQNPDTGEWEDAIARGPSIRFIECALRCMGNVDIQTPAIFDDHTKRVVRVSVVDLESNTNYSKDLTITKTVERLSLKKGETPVSTRTNSKGATLYIIAASDDQIAQKEAALVSKTIRVLGSRIVPGDLIDEGRKAAAKVRADEDAKDPDAARRALVDAFAELRVMPAEIAEYLGHELGTVSPKELEILRGLYASLRDGESVWHEVLEQRRDARKAEKEGTAGATAKTPGEERAAKVQAPKMPAGASPVKGPKGSKGDGKKAKEAPATEKPKLPDATAHEVGAKITIEGSTFQCAADPMGVKRWEHVEATSDSPPPDEPGSNG